MTDKRVFLAGLAAGAIDDLLFGDLPGIAWERTKTLGRGDDRCDFRFRRVTASSVLEEQK